MPIGISCPSCGSALKIPDSYAGRAGKCPKCGARVEVPLPSQARRGAANAGPSPDERKLPQAEVEESEQGADAVAAEGASSATAARLAQLRARNSRKKRILVRSLSVVAVLVFAVGAYYGGGYLWDWVSDLRAYNERAKLFDAAIEASDLRRAYIHAREARQFRPLDRDRDQALQALWEPACRGDYPGDAYWRVESIWVAREGQYWFPDPSSNSHLSADEGFSIILVGGTARNVAPQGIEREDYAVVDKFDGRLDDTTDDGPSAGQDEVYMHESYLLLVGPDGHVYECVWPLLSMAVPGETGVVSLYSSGKPMDTGRFVPRGETARFGGAFIIDESIESATFVLLGAPGMPIKVDGSWSSGEPESYPPIVTKRFQW